MTITRDILAENCNWGFSFYDEPSEIVGYKIINCNEAILSYLGTGRVERLNLKDNGKSILILPRDNIQEYVNSVIDFDSYGMDTPKDSSLTNYSDVYSEGDGEEGSVEEVDKEAGLSMVEKVQKANTAKARMRQSGDNTGRAVVDSSEALAQSNSSTMKALHLDKKVADSYYFGMMNTHLSNIDKASHNTIKFLDNMGRQFIDETLKYYKEILQQANFIKSLFNTLQWNKTSYINLTIKLFLKLFSFHPWMFLKLLKISQRFEVG